MNGEINNIKKIIVLISRAENLSISDKKYNKLNKWRVIVTCNKKKFMTDLISCTDGNPYWNHELEIKLTKTQIEPLVFVVIDFSNNQYGQIIIPISKISYQSISNGMINSSMEGLQCVDLGPTKKCPTPTGCLFYKIYICELFSDELKSSVINFNKRHSIFGYRFDQKSRKQSCVDSESQVDLNHSISQKLPKRLSLFKSSEKSAKMNLSRSKAKSLANINIIEDNEQSVSSDSDCHNQSYLPSDDVYNQVTRDLNWVRVEDAANDNFKAHYDPHDAQELEYEKVEVFSVQPDNGPISGNFSVVMEGTNFKSGLFDLTYVCIDGLEPIDATTCTTILSDTELVLKMPPVPIPGMVNIHLELLDGSRTTCAKIFHYIDSTIDDLQCSIFTPRPFEDKEGSVMKTDQIFDKYDDAVPLTLNGYNNFKSDASIVAKNDECFNKYDRRKLSDYGSQGSFRSDRTSSIRKKAKKSNLTKLELQDEVQNLRKEIEGLKQQMKELESSTTMQIITLTCQLNTRESDIDNISRTLCNLQMQLLEDGLTKYLELT